MSQFLIEGFSKGFDIGYEGNHDVQFQSQNLKLTVGSKVELWNKVMKEVQLKRYAGPFVEPPFKNYIQSPIGLVPKDNGTKTRLIFHLSYPRDTNISVNANTPKEKCSVNYKDFDQAIKLCQTFLECVAGKSDLSAAFRHLPMSKNSWCWLVMKAQNPVDGKFYYFVDKCLPFGASISCALFQAFSDALAHIVMYKTQRKNINYLDDYFFVDCAKKLCDQQIQEFIDICKQICFPVSPEKTVWGTTLITFLGLLIDTKRRLICIPKEKRDKAINAIQLILQRKNKKMTLGEMQKLCGILNFLGKAIIPGQAFTRRLYSHTAHLTKKHHHANVNQEMKLDLQTWLTFLNSQIIFARPFFEFDHTVNSLDVSWFTDASRNPKLGMGGVLANSNWFIAQWDEQFILDHNPSINYLELFALTNAILTWSHKYANKKLILFCDNTSVIHMVNNTTSKCKNCMVLIRLIVLQCLTHNVRIKVKYIPSKENTLSDDLSRLKYKDFRKHAKIQGHNFKGKPDDISPLIWPMNKIWITNTEAKGKKRKNVQTP